MKIREILNIEAEELQEIMTEEEYTRMRDLGFEYTWQFLDMMQDGARASELNEDDEYVTISAYLDYIEVFTK